MPFGADRRVQQAVAVAVFGLTLCTPTTLPHASAGTGQVRYAGPSGSGTSCTQSAPCDIVDAVGSAPSGAVVVLEPGSYGNAQNPLMDTIRNGTDGTTARSITIEGEPGSALPTIHEGADYGVLLINSSIQRVAIVHTGAVDGVELVNTNASQITVDSDGTQACEVFDSTIMDSVCQASRARSTAVIAQALGGETNSSTLSNVTAVDDGPDGSGTAVSCNASGASTGALEVDNTIATATDVGLAAFAVNHSACAISGTNDSSLGTATGGDATSNGTVDVQNLIGKPTFVDATNGDFHEAASSATVDAGSAQHAGGSQDLDGLPRDMGAAPDVGAYERPVPATVTNAHTTGHGHHSITVAATVDTQGLPAIAVLVAKHHHSTITGHRTTIAANSPPHKVKLVVKHVHDPSHYTLDVVVTDAGGTTTQPV